MKTQASEKNFNLHSLGWKAFQQLCVTIISSIFGQTVQSFFDSNDGGRDGAFYGVWKQFSGETLSGSFTVQCKFTSKSNEQLHIGHLTDEIEKIKNLANKGLADNYIIFTNFCLTGNNDDKIKEIIEAIPNVKHCKIFGQESLNRIILENPKLRMLVPRIYGLGDLSQILDERAYDQATEILSSLGSDLSKFVITDAYRQSANALNEHGFVLLLGEPASGKSTIAATLCLGAVDQWKSKTIKLKDANSFISHWNPNEPTQLIWVDDVFGATQFEYSTVQEWNKTFPHLNAAIDKGAKIIFTSRDYIYKTAKKFLKESSIPIIKESQVIIKVEELTLEEKEQILYNHLKLGNQDKTFKTQIKSFLPRVSKHQFFSPEIARRLGNELFTKHLRMEFARIDDFVSKNKEFLTELINSLDQNSKSAIALIFMRNSFLPSPIQLTSEEAQALELIGGTKSGIIDSLEALNDTLILKTTEDGNYYWKFKHPTIRDSFASIVYKNVELLDIYILGAPLENMIKEISCGDMNISGIELIVPKNRYEKIITKIELFLESDEKQSNYDMVFNFLERRCADDFLLQAFQKIPKLYSRLNLNSYLYINSSIDLICRLHKINLLPETYRLKFIEELKILAVETPDSGILNSEIKNLFTEHEYLKTKEYIFENLILELNECISNWKLNYDSETDPETYFDDLKSALFDFETEFEDNKDAIDRIDSALHSIDNIVSELLQNYNTSESNSLIFEDEKKENKIIERSIFDDIDA